MALQFVSSDALEKALALKKAQAQVASYTARQEAKLKSIGQKIAADMEFKPLVRSLRPFENLLTNFLVNPRHKEVTEQVGDQFEKFEDITMAATALEKGELIQATGKNGKTYYLGSRISTMRFNAGKPYIFYKVA